MPRRGIELFTTPSTLSFLLFQNSITNGAPKDYKYSSEKFFVLPDNLKSSTGKT